MPKKQTKKQTKWFVFIKDSETLRATCVSRHLSFMAACRAAKKLDTPNDCRYYPAVVQSGSLVEIMIEISMLLRGSIDKNIVKNLPRKRDTK